MILRQSMTSWQSQVIGCQQRPLPNPLAFLIHEIIIKDLILSTLLFLDKDKGMSIPSSVKTE